MTAEATTKPVQNLNAPNIIAGVRILATPFFIWMLLADNGQNETLRWAAAIFFVMAIASDALDGWLARRLNQITDLGKLLDPIADKVLIGSALVSLSILHELPWWITVVVLIRELGVTVHRLIVASSVVIAAAWMGKAKTITQAVAIALALFPFATVFGDWVVVLNIVAMTVAVVLTLLSGLDYVVGVLRSRAAQS